MGVFSENAIIGASAAGGYDIDYSIRGDGSGILERTFPSAGDRQKWTFSAWVKVSAQPQGVTSVSELISTNSVTADYMYFELRDGAHGSDATKRWIFQVHWNDGTSYEMKSNMKFRDPASWYHVVIAMDTTQVTATNRLRIYINNEEITSWQTDNRATGIAQNSNYVCQSNPANCCHCHCF